MYHLENKTPHYIKTGHIMYKIDAHSARNFGPVGVGKLSIEGKK